MISNEQRNIIKDLTSKYKPTLLGVFGSYSRNEENKESDLDILIDFEDTIDLFEIIGLEQELSEILGIKVDLITVKSIDKNLQPYIEKDLIKII